MTFKYHGHRMHLAHTFGQLRLFADMDCKSNCTLRVELKSLDPNKHEVGREALEFESARKLGLAQRQERI